MPLDELGLFLPVDNSISRAPREGYAARPIGRRRSRYRPSPARTVLRRALWERRFSTLGEQLGKLSLRLARVEQRLAAEHRQAAENAETLALILRKLTQFQHDLQLRDTPAVPLRHTRRRPLGQ
jgi:hypothetical protein